MEFFRLLLLRFIVSFCVVGCSAGYLAAQNSAIILGPIEGDLARKQIPIDLGRTPQALISLISSLYMSTEVYVGHTQMKVNTPPLFSSAGQNDIQVVLSKEPPKPHIWSTEKAEVIWRMRLAKLVTGWFRNFAFLVSFPDGYVYFRRSVKKKSSSLIPWWLMPDPRFIWQNHL